MKIEKSKTLGLALGSGGARGVAHIGILKAFEEAGVKPDYITGCSMGSVIGAAYAKGMSLDEIEDIVTNIKTFDILDISLAPITRLSLIRCQKLKKLIRKFMGETTFDELKIPFKCVATDIDSGDLVVLDKGVVADAMLASSAIPAIFRPVVIDEKRLVDGGVLCRVPFTQVKQMGADVVVAIDVLGRNHQVKEVSNIFDLLIRAFDVCDWANFTQHKANNAQSYDIWLEPQMDTVYPMQVKNLDAAIDMGYQYGKEIVDDLLEKLK